MLLLLRKLELILWYLIKENNIDTDSITKLVLGGIAGIGGLSLGVQQLVKRWKSTGAETSVLTMLHTELERMSTQNGILSGYVNSLQLEANRISLELGKLQLENQKLHVEIVSLTNEVIRLRTALHQGEEDAPKSNSWDSYRR